MDDGDLVLAGKVLLRGRADEHNRCLYEFLEVVKCRLGHIPNLGRLEAADLDRDVDGRHGCALDLQGELEHVLSEALWSSVRL